MGRKFKKSDVDFLERKGWKIWRSQVDTSNFSENEASLFRNFWRKYDQQDSPEIVLSEVARFEIFDDMRRTDKGCYIYSSLKRIDGESEFTYDWYTKSVCNAVNLRDIPEYDSFIDALNKSTKEEVKQFLGEVFSFVAVIEFTVNFKKFDDLEVSFDVRGFKLDIKSEFKYDGLFIVNSKLDSFNPYSELGIRMKDDDILKSFGLSGNKIPDFIEFQKYMNSFLKEEFRKFFQTKEGIKVKETAKLIWAAEKRGIKNDVDRINAENKRAEEETAENKRLGNIFLNEWDQEKINENVTIENFNPDIFGEAGKIVTLRNTSFIKGIPVVATLELKDHWQNFEVYTSNKELLAQYEENVRARMEEVRREREENEAWAHILDNWEPF